MSVPSLLRSLVGHVHWAAARVPVLRERGGDGEKGEYVIALVGGPYDGALSTTVKRDGFLWFERPRLGRSGTQVSRAFSAGADGREVYRFAAAGPPHDRYVYAGHTHERCPDCDGWNAVGGEKGRCALCGYVLAPAS